MRLFALRGANSVERNDASAILAATDELIREMIARNALTPETMVSCIFTLTDDLDAEFPAVAAQFTRSSVEKQIGDKGWQNRKELRRGRSSSGRECRQTT